MTKLEKTLSQMKNNPQNLKFLDVLFVCKHYFGEPRNKSSSHHIFKTPWPGDPRVNIQKSKNGMAKTYQVKQVLAAVERMESYEND